MGGGSRLKEVFVDTSGFYAFLDESDPNHDQARLLFRRARTDGWALVTTNYVVHESWALIQARLGWAAIDAWRDTLVAACRVVWITETMDAQGVARCRQARHRRLSLTDCTSFEAMAAQGIRDAIAFDEHFSREGFSLP